MENNIVITNDSFAKLEKKKTVEISVERQSVWKDIWKELKKNKVAMVSVVLLAILIIAVLLAPLSPYDPYKLDASQKLQGISSSHWFGTDEYGRDYFTRTLYGGRVSLLVGFMSMIMTVVIGTSLGVFSGYVGGKVDMFLMSFTDIFLALPEYAVNGYFKYLFKAWFTDSDCCVESVFLGIRRKNYESGDNVIKGTRFCGGYTESGGIKLSCDH